MRAKFRSPQGRSTFGAVTVMFALVALFGAGSASAAEVLDAHCGDPTNPAGSSSSSQPRVGQTFTALNTGQLTSATVSVNKSGQPPPSKPDAAFSMQIRPLVSGVPDESAAIATESVTRRRTRRAREFPPNCTTCTMITIMMTAVQVTTVSNWR